MPPKQKPHTPPSTTQQLAEVLVSAAKGIENITTSNPELKEPVRQLLNTLLTNPTIAKIRGDAQPHTPSIPSPPSLLDDVKSIKATLVALQKAITPSAQAGKPPQSKTPENAPSAPPPGQRARTPLLRKPSPADLCTGINWAMEASDNDQVRISATRWTARENVILTGGPNTTAHHLQQATHTIRQHLSETYTLPPLTIRPNVKWSKLLINSVPTGVTPDNGARTPDECHAALTSDNPSYASLNITRKPTWVQDPDSYPEGAVSLLVVAFEDLDGSCARDLLTKKVLYVFGHCATLRKWKQRPTIASPHTDLANNESNPNAEDMSDIDKAILKAAEASARTPCSEGPETSKATKGNEGRQRAGGGKGGDRPLECRKPR
ncbi:hypothetical protein EI94DRAFT_1815993 [Lactarius quietus]|nr:hypothetical protein EI94DRAFT_1815993 [Lactarius quietus]